MTSLKDFTDDLKTAAEKGLYFEICSEDAAILLGFIQELQRLQNKPEPPPSAAVCSPAGVYRPAGYYQHCGIVLATKHKPLWLHRKVNEWLAGWKWHEGYRVHYVKGMIVIGMGLEWYA